MIVPVPEIAGPRIGLGCNTLGSIRAGGSVGSLRIVHHAIDHGVRLFDTADAYGDGTSERVLGKALVGRRDSLTLATKAGYCFDERSVLKQALRQLVAPVLSRVQARKTVAAPAAVPSTGSPAVQPYSRQDFSTVYLAKALDGSLRRLRTDYVDVFQLHGPKGVYSSDVPVFMQDMIRAGKIRGFGVGLESLVHAADWLAVDGLTHLQIPFGVLDPQAGRELIGAAYLRGVAVIARGIFAAGLLADIAPEAERRLDPLQRQHRQAVREIAASVGVHPLALAAWYVRRTEGVNAMLIGVSSMAHFNDNLKHLLLTTLSDEVLDRVRYAVDAYLAALAARGEGS